MTCPVNPGLLCKQGVRTRQRGAALLSAMVIVTLVATLSASMVWQQWRAVQVEGAERVRSQAGWVLTGALDWARLILREDQRSGGPDHLGEPWAIPLAEARLSTFLAANAENNAEAVDDSAEAFLSGRVEDANARYNLRNLLDADGKIAPTELLVLRRLCEYAGLSPTLADGVADAWRRASLAVQASQLDDAEVLASLGGADGLSSAQVGVLRKRQKRLPAGRPHPRQHRARADVDGDGQRGLFHAHHRGAHVAHHSDEAGHLQRFAQAQQRGLAHAHRVALAQGRQADAHRGRPQVVVLGGGVLRHHVLLDEAEQVAVHLGRVFIHLGGDGGQAGIAKLAVTMQHHKPVWLRWL